MGKPDRKQKFKAGFLGCLYDRESRWSANEMKGQSRDIKGNKKQPGQENEFVYIYIYIVLSMSIDFHGEHA